MMMIMYSGGMIVDGKNIIYWVICPTDDSQNQRKYYEQHVTHHQTETKTLMHLSSWNISPTGRSPVIYLTLFYPGPFQNLYFLVFFTVFYVFLLHPIFFFLSTVTSKTAESNTFPLILNHFFFFITSKAVFRTLTSTSWSILSVILHTWVQASNWSLSLLFSVHAVCSNHNCNFDQATYFTTSSNPSPSTNSAC